MPVRHNNVYIKIIPLSKEPPAELSGIIISLLKPMKTSKNTVEVVIETPKGSFHKYIWDEERMVIKLKKCMPPGFVFPFSFGMIPGTKAADGDPVDVLLLMEAPVYPGTFMNVKIIAGLKATQKQVSENRNDRLIAVEKTCPVYGDYENLQNLSLKFRRQIEDFFRSYNEVQGKEFTNLGWADVAEAMQLIKDASL